ncbi:hypothetical protein KIN20_011365 [Parelaphostrongylus tenuis]|uniref:MKRN2 opposite strand protein-like C-terminal domain-containing protein n=1 Tax=Parelaphostrongylus tenuis TaxID=148309 RepID=A0AAD5QKZ3_PARTN|nr:hypothetical protein KIN20_011365 [Parelaphostrongylus tenuis]
MCYEWFSSWVAEPLPCPFVATGDFAYAIIVKPSRGTFLQYRIGDDLHIGISDGSSIVYSYWLSGVRSEKTGWDNSAIVYRFTTEKQRFDKRSYPLSIETQIDFWLSSITNRSGTVSISSWSFCDSSDFVAIRKRILFLSL